MFLSSTFDYDPKVRCEWHEEEDSRICALATIKRAWYVGLFVCLFVCGVRPPLNKKLFPVNWPGGSKRADWNFFFHLFNNKKKKKDLRVVLV